jgi:hypothetical protein
MQTIMLSGRYPREAERDHNERKDEQRQEDSHLAAAGGSAGPYSCIDSSGQRPH